MLDEDRSQGNGCDRGTEPQDEAAPTGTTEWGLVMAFAGNTVRTIAAARPDHEAERGQEMGMMIVGPSDPTGVREMLFDNCLWGYFRFWSKTCSPLAVRGGCTCDGNAEALSD